MDCRVKPGNDVVEGATSGHNSSARRPHMSGARRFHILDVVRGLDPRTHLFFKI
jgi:hypothetical protein